MTKRSDPNAILREQGSDALRQKFDESEPRRKTGNRQTERRGNGLDPGVVLDDFQAYMPMHSYIYTPSRRDVAGEQRECPLAAGPNFWRER